MILIDTSIWVATFRRRDPFDLAAAIDFDDVVTCLPVLQEVLQGFRDETAFRQARSSMMSLPTVESPMEAGVYLEAAGLYRTARKAGLTIRSSTDCLIAACALRHGLEVLHRDRDFPALARISALQERAV